MKTVSMLELRRNALSIVRGVQDGERVLLTYRGKPVARLEPLDEEPAEDDRFYDLPDLAEEGGVSLSNREIDETLYGP